MTQSQHTDHHENSAEANTHHADHSAQAHEAPASAPLFEGSGPKDWEEQFGPSVAIFSALANPLRLALAHHLMHRPHSVSELHTCLGISQPLASHHLRILREAHVIDREQQGRTTIYRLKDDHISHIVVDVYEHTREHHAD
ncbi:metalloregulator ArsR/SmtB family transcription factor [Rothia mucilaginosa]|uniref:ArsR/SmtB family transcription factor n=1 Tax=Rothia mucilaginosa TaxID=43675 RepID=UPI0028DB08E8|nr:metalloregulator ArsR/SmtB family transcription factor [Rothia mucilaginosa]